MLRHYRLFADHIEIMAAGKGLSMLGQTAWSPDVQLAHTETRGHIHLPGAALAEMERLIGSQRLLLGSPTVESPRHKLGASGAPKWSPDGQAFRVLPALAQLPGGPPITNA